ncbi:MAG: 3-methyl-2-oxobutanoate hydroxymethyltransferase [Turneriella sp.]|nr:3-methyl-2-oxobutanoate hydroxymethyltransferase [Turneriella sp.]
MPVSYEYILALGTNVGDREQNLARAREGIARIAEIQRVSRVLETWPILIRAQARFLNQGLYVKTPKNPSEFLMLLQSIEIELGRKKRVKNGPREIDIDIIWSSEGLVETSVLRIPHPFNRARSWIREIMYELAPETIDVEAKLEWKKIQGRSIMNIHDFAKKKEAGEKITVVTCYDHAFARLVARTSIDAILVGDSLGNVIQGNPNTLSVTLDEIIYHTKIVRKGAPQTFLIADLPFMSYQTRVEDALYSAGRILKETGADAVKLEGGSFVVEQVKKMVQSGIPVVGHLGLTPQSVLAFGGYKVQGKSVEAAKQILEDARLLEEAGVFALVLEMVPEALAQKITETIRIPTIGIGAGVKTDGQVLVLTDLLGLDPDFSPRFVRKYANLSQVVLESLEKYASDVREKNFPQEKETFS